MDAPRTESATPRKLARARRQGIVPKSSDLVVAAMLFALLGSLIALGGRLLRAFEAILTQALRAAALPTPPGLEQLAMPAREIVWLALGPLLALALAAVLANVVQVGPLFSAVSAAPDLRRAAPFARLRALASSEHWLSLLIALWKAGVLCAVAVFVLLDARHALSTLGAGGALRALFVLCALGGQLVLYVAIAAALLGAGDLVYRRVQHARSLRMSRRELAQEQREDSGRPEHRQLRRRVHAELSAQGALDTACVLLIDARDRAIALAFDAELDTAPRVALKAQGAIAVAARAQAERVGLPTRIAPELVTALFPLELTEQVPRAQHAAVAELMRDLIASGELPAPSDTRDAP